MPIQFKRGTADKVAEYIGPIGELIVDTDNKIVLLQDGATPGGVPLGGLSDNAPVRLNPNTINKDYTFPVGFNGVSAGPITIADGVTITIPDGAEWSIV